jgi:formate dehydrogenase major subunit
MDRRAFLRRSGLAAGGAAGMLPLSFMERAEARENIPKDGVKTEIRRTICPHCSVGCGVIAEVQNGVWTGQEPDFDSPINLGAHCTKGASLRFHDMGNRRTKYPMKLTGGKWQRISWDQAIQEIGDKFLQIRKESGPTPSSGAAPPRRATRAPTSSGSSPPSGAPTTSTTRPASATPPPSPAWPTPGATAP